MRRKVNPGPGIFHYRKAAGYTQQQLANMCSLRSGDISGFETGRRVPLLGDMYQIALLLHTTIENLIEDKEIENDRI